ncbi:3-phosphoserine phosphatase [Artemisia annua]|uniref:phosphoserine phosphatase n=1 Tax=Artemisia annua TaxID=35608 RepID=A0A2U1M846_ARTAN|nr:3-phosphoserine phosphatase [Artemisia annua]
MFLSPHTSSKNKISLIVVVADNSKNSIGILQKTKKEQATALKVMKFLACKRRDLRESCLYSLSNDCKAIGTSVPFEKALADILDHFKPSLAGDQDFLEKRPQRLSPGINELVQKLQEKGKSAYLISGGFRQMISEAFKILVTITALSDVQNKKQLNEQHNHKVHLNHNANLQQKMTRHQPYHQQGTDISGTTIPLSDFRKGTQAFMTLVCNMIIAIGNMQQILALFLNSLNYSFTLFSFSVVFKSVLGAVGIGNLLRGLGAANSQGSGYGN